MEQLKHFIKRDEHSHNRYPGQKSGAYKTKREAMRDGEVLGLTAWQHEDGSWDLE